MFVTGLCINTFFSYFKRNSQYLRVMWWGTEGWEPMRIEDGRCTGGKKGRNWLKYLAKLHKLLQ